jgi:pyridoxamine 5'-phosphate oxidase
MKDKLADMRQEYDKDVLHRDQLDTDPLVQFEKWFEEVTEEHKEDPHAFTLATADAKGKPSSRIVLLKGIEEEKFVFYTNYDSKKGRDMAENPYVSATFFWPALQRQVRIEGTVAKVSAEMSDSYFHSRPEGSRLGAWASPQSDELESREVLENRWKNLSERFSDGEIPRPDNWGGYAINPTRIEFWQGRPSRLHDRFSYSKDNGSWKIARLAP